MIKTILIDDEKPALNNLERCLKDYTEIHIIATFTDVIQAIEKVKTEEINLIFLDIEMPKMRGLEAAKRILKINGNVQIVFVTAYNNYAIEAFELEAIDYIMKPIIKSRLDKTMKRVLKRHAEFLRDDNTNKECKIFCFGNFEIRRGQQKIKWRTSKAQEFAAFLVHNRGEYVHKSKIIDALWQEKDEKHATKLLHTNVYYVRNALKDFGLEQVIKCSNKMYKIDLEKLFYDFGDFDKALDEHDIINKGNVDNISKIVQLYKGEYFEDNDYYWAINEQARLREKYIKTLIGIADYFLKQADYREATDYLKIILQKEPFFEEIHKKLLFAYKEMGDYANFKSHYKSTVDSFQKELGVELDAIIR